MAKKPEFEVLWKDRKHWMWFPFSFTKYSLGNNRIYIQTGFFNTHYDETLLYRVIDICLERTFWQKVFGTGTIVLICKANAESKVHLKNIKNPVDVKYFLSAEVEKSRKANNVVGKEFWGSQPGEHGPDHGPEFDPDGVPMGADLDGDGIPDMDEGMDDSHNN